MPNTELEIPAHFLDVPYVADRFVVADIRAGANCQAFAYALLRHYGRHISNFRSSDLWQDTSETERVDSPLPLDLLLFNGAPESYGAHVGVWLGGDRVIHLSRRLGKPAVWSLRQFETVPGYEVLVGIKRTLR